MRYLSRSEADWIAGAVVMIRHGESTGTGFFVGPGVVASCDHVLDPTIPDPPRLTWRGGDLEVTGITRPKGSRLPDLALVAVTLEDHQVLPLVPEGPLFGADVYSFGFQYTDRGYTGYSFWGLLSGVAIDTSGVQPQELLVISRANVPPGASGAPLFSLAADGVVGVVKRSNPDGGGYAVPVKDLDCVQAGLLENNRRAAPGAPFAHHALSSYVTSLLHEHSYVTLVDLNRKLKLDEIYVSLSIAAKTVTGAPIELDAAGGLASVDAVSLTKLGPWRDLGGPARHYAQPDVPLEELLSQQTAIVLGEPGIGKTTLLRHLVARTCKGELFPTRVPVFIRLAQLKPEPGAVAQFVGAAYSAHANAIAQANDEGRCVYFLDGLDEVGRSHHQLLQSEIDRLAANGNQVYVTCRTAAFPRGLFSSAFRTYECTGFNWYQQRRFLGQWFAAQPDVAARLGRELRANPELGEFGRNPLLLSMLAVLTESNSVFRLSPRRVELYDAALKLFLERRASATTEITRRAKSRLLETLAFSLMLSGAETVLEDDLLEWLDTYRQAATTSTALKGLESEQIFEVLVQDDGVLARAGAHGVRFLHRTFQEYLASRRLAGLDDWLGIAAERREDARWEEVLRLLSSRLTQDDADQLIRVLQPLGNGTAADTLDRLVLAARCASDAPALSPKVLDELVAPLLTYAFDHDLEAEVADGVAALGVLCRGHSYAYDVVSSALRSRLSSGATLSEWSGYVQLLDLIGNERSTAELISFAERIEEQADAGDEASLLLFGSAILGIGHSADVTSNEFVASRVASKKSYVAAIATMALSDLPSPTLADHLQSVATSADEVHSTLVAHLLLTALTRDRMRDFVRQTFADPQRRLEQLVARQVLDPTALEPDAHLVEALLVGCPGDLDKAALVGIPSLMAYADHEAVLDAIVFDDLSGLPLRCAAIDTLLRLNSHRGSDVVNRLLTSGPPEVCRGALATLARTGNDDAHVILAARIGPQSEQWLLDSSLRLFTAVPSATTVDCLLRLLAGVEHEPETRLRVVRALAGTGSPEAGPYLVRYLDPATASPRERCIAYSALALVHTPDAADTVLAHLPHEPDIYAIGRGIESLGELGGERAEAFLLNVLDAERWPATWPPRQSPPEQGDQRPSDQRCLAAVIALNRLASTSAVADLNRLMQDPDEAPEVRHAAFIAVRTIAWSANSPADASAIRRLDPTTLGVG